MDFTTGSDQADGRYSARIVVGEKGRQEVLDLLQSALSGTDDWRIIILPVEAILPLPTEEEAEKAARERKKEKVGSSGATREELYQVVSKGASADTIFLILVFLSTIVAAIGLLGDDVAVVIGAMVIAPLLGPNLALSFSIAIGDAELFWRSIRANAVGLVLCLGISIAMGATIPLDLGSAQLMARTGVEIDGVVLALASGAAAALSLTSGLSATLVGVMVAVALLPPTATFGLMAGDGRWDLALGAATLLAVNIVCVNLAAQLVFFVRGIRPRIWFEVHRAKRALRLTVTVWLALLATLVAVILLRSS
ncbi:TIGR00341 family protein [Magnetospira thiophila]